MTNPTHTPGPWRWEVNRSHKSVKLCGGPPKSGHGRYDLTVMDFRRYGMTGAAPVFWHWDYNKFVGKPERADDLAIPVEGREHHADWFADINHADARLIAAAPELLEALRGAAAALEDSTGLDDAICCCGHDCGCRGSTNRDLLVHDLRAAIAKALTPEQPA